MFIVISAAFVWTVSDPDYWWHLRTGRWIVENHRLPGHDIFTYTVPGHAWIDHEYLTEALIWLIYSHAGLAAFSLIVGAVTWLGFLLIYKRADGGRQPYVIAGLGIALGASAGGPIWGPRAQMLTFFLACLELYWLERYLWGRSRAVNFLPLVIALWANLHGSWIFGLALIGVALASEAILWALRRDSALHRAHVRRLAIIAAVSSVAVLANPQGLGLLLYPFQTQGSIAQQKLIVEWFSPDFHQLYLKPFEIMLLVLIVGMILHRPRLYDVLLTLTVLVLVLQSVRHVALFIAATTPILIWSWAGVWRDLSARRPGLRLLADRSGAIPSRLLAVTSVLVLTLVALAAGARISSELRQQPHETQTTFPVEAADYMAAHPQLGHRMYNQYGWGGYLLNRFYPDPDRRVFIFGEAALMGDPMLNRYQDVQTLRSDWRQVLDDYRVDYIVYTRGEALDNVLRSLGEDWRLEHSDPVAVIYVRKKPLVSQ